MYLKINILSFICLEFTDYSSNTVGMSDTCVIIFQEEVIIDNLFCRLVLGMCHN
jgi:hypothetical protein